MQERVSDYRETLVPMIVDYGINIIGAILILIAGFIVARWASNKTMRWAVQSEKVDNTLAPILSQVIRVGVIIVTLLAVLGQFGVETTSIVAVLGASALAVGLALQGTLSNIAAGVMILSLRPFRVGDAVNIGDTMGVVDEVGLFTTEMHTFDNIGISMPNSQVWGAEIQNLNRFETRRVDFQFGIGYEEDVEKALSLINEILSKDERVLADPAPLIEVSELADESVNIIARPWSKRTDYWPLKFDVIKKVKERFDEEKIGFAVPKRDIYLHKEE